MGAALWVERMASDIKPVMGRPSLYTLDLAAAICAGIADGESLRRICMGDGMPAMSTVFLWLQKYPDFLENYREAQRQRVDAFAEDLLAISDDSANDWVEKRDADGNVIGEALNAEHVQRSKLRVDTRKWLLSRMDPKRFGDRVVNEHTGKDGGPVQVNITGTDTGLL